MGCNCSQGQNGVANRGVQRNPNPSPQGVPAVGPTKVEFFLSVDGEEQAFDRLSDAKKVSKESGGATVNTRRVQA